MNHHLRSLFRLARTFKGIVALSMTSFLVIVGISMAKATAQSTSTQPIPQTAAKQIQALVQEKLSRTQGQRKISSSLLYALKAKRGDALIRSIPSLSTAVRFRADNKVRVDIKTISPVTPDLVQQIKATGSEVLFSSPSYNRIQAFVPVTQVENIASLPAVRTIRQHLPPRLLRDTAPQSKELLKVNNPFPGRQHELPAAVSGSADARSRSVPKGRLANATLSRSPQRNENLSSPTPDSQLPTPYFQVSQNVLTLEQKQKRLAKALPEMVKRLNQVPGGLLSNLNSVTSEGDKAHGAALARYTYRVDGSYTKHVGSGTTTQRVKIGVLSDSYNNLGGAATDIANGDLPSDGVTLVGSGDLPSTSPHYPGIDEGRAMLQIIHDLAPGAKLYFATAVIDEADFASNIRALRQAGCDIIVDDLIYFSEPVFQDGIIAQAVNNVTARGALYFSSAGNLGNKNDSQSGVWEGDFLDGGAAPLRLSGRVHRFTFGTTGLSNKITDSQSSSGIMLQWSDPWGQSTNDYDLYVLNSAGTAVIASSTDFQNGNADPIELVPPQAANSQVIVVQYSGQPRYLHLNILGGRLATNTPGQTWGHSAAVNAFSVAAVSAKGRVNLFTGGADNPVETFSSDGLRRVFYRADGTPITPGIFLSYGGSVRQKPDIAGADGVKTSLPSPLNRFYGTSAEAPHAAGVAALLKSFRPSLTSAEIRSILTSTSLDIEAGGVDQNSGYGIVMANRALDKAAQTPIVSH